MLFVLMDYLERGIILERERVKKKSTYLSSKILEQKLWLFFSQLEKNVRNDSDLFDRSKELERKFSIANNSK